MRDDGRGRRGNWYGESDVSRFGHICFPRTILRYFRHASRVIRPTHWRRTTHQGLLSTVSGHCVDPPEAVNECCTEARYTKHVFVGSFACVVTTIV